MTKIYPGKNENLVTKQFVTLPRRVYTYSYGGDRNSVQTLKDEFNLPAPYKLDVDISLPPSHSVPQLNFGYVQSENSIDNNYHLLIILIM